MDINQLVDKTIKLNDDKSIVKAIEFLNNYYGVEKINNYFDDNNYDDYFFVQNQFKSKNNEFYNDSEFMYYLWSDFLNNWERINIDDLLFLISDMENINVFNL